MSQFELIIVVSLVRCLKEEPEGEYVDDHTESGGCQGLLSMSCHS